MGANIRVLAVAAVRLSSSSGGLPLYRGEARDQDARQAQPDGRAGAEDREGGRDHPQGRGGAGQGGPVRGEPVLPEAAQKWTRGHAGGGTAA
ncbi:hypothetical protein [Streptomyces sp. ADMS]|uniref:hypothetical protein n=1 Tax=Streptomyces sp. ADMS TaxID=3071415 RepID=UPI00399379C7